MRTLAGAYWVLFIFLVSCSNEAIDESATSDSAVLPTDGSAASPTDPVVREVLAKWPESDSTHIVVCPKDGVGVRVSSDGFDPNLTLSVFNSAGEEVLGVQSWNEEQRNLSFFPEDFLEYSHQYFVQLKQAGKKRLEWSFWTRSEWDSRLVVNELMASNFNIVADEVGEFEDWFELYNGSCEDRDLSGYFLSDNPRRPDKFQIPMGHRDGAYLIKAGGGRLLFWASGEADRGKYHVNFRLARGGESLLLTRPDGQGLVDQRNFSQQRTNISFGRYPDGGQDWFYMDEPSPHTANRPGYRYLLEERPKIITSPGFYRGQVWVEVHSDSNLPIYYTLDGTQPTAASSVYTEPLVLRDPSPSSNVFSMIPTNRGVGNPERTWIEPIGLAPKVNALRVAHALEDHLSPSAETATYVVDFQTDLPIISIIAEPSEIWGDSRGIYVPGNTWILDRQAGRKVQGNFRRKGRQWERMAHIDFFEAGTSGGFSGAFGVRIHGGSSRLLPNKGLRLYVRDRENENVFDYPFFQTGSSTFKNLLLRTSGQDFGRSLFRDAVAQSLVVDKDVELQRYQPTVVFMNGEYWGIKNIRDRQDLHYLKYQHGADPEAVDLLTNNSQVKAGAQFAYTELLEFAEESSFERVGEILSLSDRMDIENFFTYYSLQLYCGNVDWPQNNIDYWRSHDGGRWRWLVYDLDYCFGLFNDSTHDPVTRLFGDEWWSKLFRSLMRSSSLQSIFVNRLLDMLNENFDPGRVISKIDHFQENIRSEIPRHIERWRRPSSVEEWEAEVELMRQYAVDRPDILREHLANGFGLEDQTSIVRIEIRGDGYVRLNSLTLTEQDSPWEGVYLTQNPIYIEPVASSKPWSVPDLLSIEPLRLKPGVNVFSFEF